VNLIDIVRDQTRQIQDLLKGTEKELEERIRNQVAAQERDRKLRQEAAELQPVVSERERTCRESQLKVQEIERQIAELQARLRERQKEHERAQAELTAAQGEVADRLRKAARARKEAEDWERQATEARERAEKYQRRLLEERRAAVQKYLAALWTQLLDVERKAASSAEARAALDGLNRARHDDPQVAELWEARLEWLRIAQSAGPPRVRETARAELKRIEDDLESRFPGALKVSSAGALEELEEVYFYHRATDDSCRLLLPIPAEVCGSLDAGVSAAPEDLAARIVWAFARGIETKGNHPGAWRSRFHVKDGHLVMTVEGGPEDMKNHETITVLLAGGGRVVFMLCELPPEIRGAMDDEGTNS
jgi:hypothetical protein